MAAYPLWLLSLRVCEGLGCIKRELNPLGGEGDTCNGSLSLVRYNVPRKWRKYVVNYNLGDFQSWLTPRVHFYRPFLRVKENEALNIKKLPGNDPGAGRLPSSR